MIAIFLQGILEALPISSSIHLNIFNISNIELMHLGTGIAFFSYNIKYLKKYIKHPYSLKTIKFALKVVLTIMPTVAIGFYIKKQPKLFDPYLINLIFAITMLYANQFEAKRKFDSLNVKEIIIISVLISLALLPGASRLGTTFTVLRLFSLTLEESFINSLIIGIPITLGAAFLNLTTHKPDLIIIGSSLLAGILTYITLHITEKYLKYWNFYVLYRISFSLFQLYVLKKNFSI